MSRKHSTVHWTLYLTPEFVLSTSKLITILANKTNQLFININKFYL